MPVDTQNSQRISPFDRWALMALLVGTIVVRIAAIMLDPAAFRDDVDDYRRLAENLVRLGVYGYGEVPTAYRSPLYPLVLAGLAELGVLTTAGLAVLHVVLGTATAWLSVIVGRWWGLGSWRFLAAALVACDPILVRQSTLVMSETLAALLVAAALAALTAMINCVATRSATPERDTLLWALGAGAALALGVLCRPVFAVWLVATPLCLVWILPREARRMRVVAAVFIAAIVVLAPWGLRNQVRFGRPILTTTHGGFTLLLGNNAEFYAHLRATPRAPWDAAEFNRAVLDARRAEPHENEPAADRREYAKAWQTIREKPSMFARAVAYRETRLWGVLPLALSGQSPRERVLRYATAVWYVLEFVLALVGLWSLGRRSVTTPWLFGLLLAASFSAVHALYWTDMRMRAPLEPAIACAAAAGGAWIWGKFTRRNPLYNKQLRPAVEG